MSDKEREISLKEFIIKIRGLWNYLLSKWLAIVLVALAGGIIGLLYSIYTKPKYTGELVFVLSSGSKSGGGLASLAGQFGVDIGGSDDDAFSGDNILELFKSEKIIKGALFRTLPGTNELLINRIIDKMELQKKWSGNERVKNSIPFPDDVRLLTPVQDSLVSFIHGFLLKGCLNFIRQDKKLSFYKVNSVSTDEVISTYLTRYVVDEASQFYIETKTKSAKSNLDMLQHEADSLRSRLNGKIYSVAETADETFNLNPALMTKRVSMQQNQAEGQVLGVAYGEVVKDLEIAKITLQKEKPLFQIIDEPSLPLVKDKVGRLKGAFIGAILAGFLAVVFLLLREIIKRIMYT